MEWFTNLKVKVKLIIMILFLSIIIIIVGFLSMGDIRSMSQAANQAYEYNIIPLSYLIEITENLQRTRTIMRNIFLADEKAEYNDQMRKLKERNNLIDEFNYKYEQSILNDEEKTAFINYKKFLEKCRRKNSEIINILEMGNRNQALFIMRSDGNKVNNEVQNGIDNLKQLKLRLVKSNADKNNYLAEKSQKNLLLFIFTGSFVSILIGYYISHKLSLQVKEILNIVNKFSAGDLTVKINTNSKDEMGLIAEKVNMVIETQRRQVFDLFKKADILTKVSQSLLETSEITTASSKELLNQISSAAKSSESISSNITSTSASANEIENSVREISKNTSAAFRITTESANKTREASKTMSRLFDSSNEIGGIIKVITSIAEQTNLLALNATIEAARAGEAGKGFSVVANEVKELSKETAKATEDISNRIKIIQNDSQAALTGIQEISEISLKINDISDSIASAIEEQTATTGEISKSLTEVSKNSSDISMINRKILESVSGFSDQASELKERSKDIRRVVKDLKKQLEEGYKV